MALAAWWPLHSIISHQVDAIVPELWCLLLLFPAKSVSLNNPHKTLHWQFWRFDDFVAEQQMLYQRTDWWKFFNPHIKGSSRASCCQNSPDAKILLLPKFWQNFWRQLFRSGKCFVTHSVFLHQKKEMGVYVHKTRQHLAFIFHLSLVFNIHLDPRVFGRAAFNPTTRIPNSSACPPVRHAKGVTFFSGGVMCEPSFPWAVKFKQPRCFRPPDRHHHHQNSIWMGNFGFSGKFRILGEISDFRGNFGFSGKFRILGEISDFRGNFGF